jgi:TPR repeat protein
MLGWMYEDGDGMPVDMPQAFAWYTRAADKQDPAGLPSLGRMCEYGNTVSRDFDRPLNCTARQFHGDPGSGHTARR